MGSLIRATLSNPLSSSFLLYSMLSSKKSSRSRSAGEPSVSLATHASFNGQEVPSEIIRCLQDSRLVEGKAVEQLIPLMHIRRLAAGELIIKEGTLGRSIFILLQGQVTVVSEACESEIGVLGPGNVLGEIGGLLDVPRTMTVRAKGAGCTVGVIMREDVAKVPTLVTSLLSLAQSRLEADEAREASVLQACPSKKHHLEASYEQMFNKKPPNDGRFVKRANRWVMLLTKDQVKVHVVEGGVSVRDAANGAVIQRHVAGDAFDIPKGDYPFVVQATGKTCIYYQILNHSSQPQNDDFKSLYLMHLESKDTFGAAIEQASRLGQIIAGNNYRRSSIAVWSDESFLRPVSQPVFSEAKRRRMSTPVSSGAIDSERPEDVVDLLQQMGVPAEPFRQSILRKNNDGTISVSLDSIHQYFDNEVLEAILLLSGPLITSLSLQDCWSLSDACLAAVMRSCPMLRALAISNCWSLTENGFAEALKIAPKSLTDLVIRSCPGLTDSCLEPLSKLNIKSLDLSYCKNLGDNTWNHIVKLDETLESLSLRRLSKVSGESILRALQDGCIFEKMKQLDLSDCSLLSDSAISRTVQACPNLVGINISFCQDLDVSFFKLLADSNPSKTIREITAEHCQAFVTDETCALMADKMSDITLFDARGCSQLTSVSLGHLSKLPHLKNVDLSGCPLIDVNSLTKAALVRSWNLAHPPILFG